MRCPRCGGDTRVVDSRSDYDSVWRRRECRICGHRFSTTESATTAPRPSTVTGRVALDVTGKWHKL